MPVPCLRRYSLPLALRQLGTSPFAVHRAVRAELVGSPSAVLEQIERVSAERVSAVRTYTPRASEIERTWYVVDAEGLTLGRMSTEVARVLRGKHKATFTPHIDTGDHVIIINADKVVLTSGKAEKKMVHRHTGYPGGIRSTTYAHEMATKPEDAVRRTVRGMLPKNRLGRQQLKKLKVYTGSQHPHSAQKPQPLVIDAARARS